MSAPAPSELPSYRGYRYSAEIISPAIWLYFRFSLCLRDVEEFIAERGAAVMHETMRAWGSTFGPHDAGGRSAAAFRRDRADVGRVNSSHLPKSCATVAPKLQDKPVERKRTFPPRRQRCLLLGC